MSKINTKENKSNKVNEAKTVENIKYELKIRTAENQNLKNGQKLLTVDQI